MVFTIWLYLQCLDGFTDKLEKVRNETDTKALIEELDKDNKYSIDGHKKCYVAEAEWLLDPKQNEETQESIPDQKEQP